ncbi:MAG: glycosyl transferase family 1 [Flavobacteriaceae bacterium]|nr:glycosyl transferase family 1 [Flavobacteriaceae bacterium]
MNIAIVTNKPYATCETFIKAQIDKLPFICMQYWVKEAPFVSKTKNKSVVGRVVSKMHSAKDTSATRIVNELKQQNIDVVLAQYGMIGTLMTEACSILNLPLVVHFHGHDAVRKSVLEKYGERYTKMFAYVKTTVVSVSHEMTRRLVALGCPEDKIRYNTYGPADSFLEVQPTYASQQFVFIGRFVEKKAPHLLLLAFSKVLVEFPDAQLVCAGDGPLLDSSKDLAHALGMNDSVDFVGRINHATFKEQLRNSIAYVQHSVEAIDGDMEGTPVSILEASGAGLAVISTTHAGIPDVIVHEKTGLLCNERDADAMAQHMLQVLRHPDEAKAMGVAGKNHIAKNFSQKTHLEGLTTIIKEASTH